MRDSFAVVGAFALIFAFSSVDSAISPLVKELHTHFAVPMDQVLLLISSATIGTVTGVLVGPAFTAAYSVRVLMMGCGIGLTLSLLLFLMVDGFRAAQVARLIFGLSSGMSASCMWWLTFEGVAKTHYQAMITVLMSARPLATAIGVPMAGMIAARAGWSAPFWVFAVVLAVSGVLVVWALGGKNEGEKRPLSFSRIIEDYVAAFRVPYAIWYYLGFTINRMAYFGFYAFSGIWFIRHYGLSLDEISRALFLIGLGEALVNFSVPWMLRHVGHAPLFLGSLSVSAVLLPLFIGGGLPYLPAIALITVFMILDRIYCMTMVISIPQMFPAAQNRTVFGSLNTLTAWGGLTLIAAIESTWLEAIGLVNMGHVLTACFVVGSLMLYVVQRQTVLWPSSVMASTMPAATQPSARPGPSETPNANA